MEQLVLQVCAYLIGVPLEVMVIAALLRGEYRKYPFVFLYAVVDLLTTVLEIPYALQRGSGGTLAHKQWAMVFWINEQIMQVLVLLLVISLVYIATKDMRTRRTLLTGVICGTVLVAVISFWVNYDPHSPLIGPWMTRWTRNLNFCSAMLDLGLWALLISARQKDYKLLLVTGALGIQFTGGAIGQALRDAAPAIVKAASYFLMFTNLARIYIWWQVFRDKPRPVPAGSVSHK